MNRSQYYIMHKKHEDYLMHHGVDGQKWGVKHGPPYPLDDSTSTGKRLKIRKERQTKVAEKYRAKKIKRFTKKRDKIEKKIYKDPEKVNSRRNMKRQYAVNEINDRLNDLKNMSVASLLDLRNFEFSQNLYGVMMPTYMLMHADDSNENKFKQICDSFSEEQKQVIVFLMILVMDEMRDKEKKKEALYL